MQWTTNEFCIEWVKGDPTATVTAPEGSALNTRLTRLAEEYPKEVEVVNSELFHVPYKWVRINPPMKLSEEEKKRRAELLKRNRNAE
jgi:hypothetical protein